MAASTMTGGGGGAGSGGSGSMPGRGGKSAIPVAHHGLAGHHSSHSPQSHSNNHSNPSPIPEERFNASAGVEKGRNMAIDPKFLMKRDEAIPVRGLLNASQKTGATMPSSSPRLLPSASSSTPLQSSSSAVVPLVPGPSSTASQPLYINSTRLSQQMIVPKPQPPLASAYFPNSNS